MAILDNGQIIIDSDDLARTRPLFQTLDVRHHAHELAIVTENAIEVTARLDAEGVHFRVTSVNLDEIFETDVASRTDNE